MKRTQNFVSQILVLSLLFGAPALASTQKQSTIPDSGKGKEKTAAGKKEAATSSKAKEAEKPAADAISIAFKVPVFSPLFSSFPVATVEDQKITLEELNQALASLHETAGEMGAKDAGSKNFRLVLNRLINSKLVVFEAQNMGLDELPQVKQAIDDYRLSALRDELKYQQIKDLKPDKAEVAKLYKEVAKEWKIKSIRFEKEDKAKEMAAAIQTGGDFDKLAAKAIADKNAQGTKDGQYMKPKDLLPQVAAYISTMKVGAITPVMPVGPAFMILKLQAIRYPAGDKEAQAAAEQQALELKRLRTLDAYNKKITARYGRINKALVDKLDFEAATPGFKELLRDKRVVVEMKKGKPVTVADLATALQEKFFHGIDEAIKEKKVNEKKMSVLQDMLYKSLYVQEARRLGIDKSESYLKKLADFKDSILFGSFIEKVAAPDVKISEEEMKAYYKEHIAEYSSPEMMRIKSLAFSKKESAEKALAEMKKGTEFSWVQKNAEGQADKNSSGLLEFDGSLLVIKNLPENIQEALAGAKADESRIAGSKEGFTYLLYVDEKVPPKPQPLQEVRKPVAKKIFNAKLNKIIDDWGTKLRENYDVKVFVTDLGK